MQQSEGMVSHHSEFNIITNVFAHINPKMTSERITREERDSSSRTSSWRIQIPKIFCGGILEQKLSCSDNGSTFEQPNPVVPNQKVPSVDGWWAFWTLHVTFRCIWGGVCHARRYNFSDSVLPAGQRGRIVIPLQKQPSPWVKVTTFQRGKKSREVAINKGEHMPIIYASLLFLCKFWGGSRSTMIF